MNLATAFAIFAVKGSSPATPGAGPSAAPISLLVENYGSPKKARLTWTNGDATAYTRVYDRDNDCSGTEYLLTTVNPGVTSYDTTITVAKGFAVSHYKNGQESAKSTCFAWDPAAPV